MNVERFVGRNYQEALRKVKEVLGEDCTILKTGKSEEGTYIVAMQDDQVPVNRQSPLDRKSSAVSRRERAQVDASRGSVDEVLRQAQLTQEAVAKKGSKGSELFSNLKERFFLKASDKAVIEDEPVRQRKRGADNYAGVANDSSSDVVVNAGSQHAYAKSAARYADQAGVSSVLDQFPDPAFSRQLISAAEQRAAAPTGLESLPQDDLKRLIDEYLLNKADENVEQEKPVLVEVKKSPKVVELRKELQEVVETAATSDGEAAHQTESEDKLENGISMADPVKMTERDEDTGNKTAVEQFEADLKSAESLVRWGNRILHDIQGLQESVRRKILPRVNESNLYAEYYQRLLSAGFKPQLCKKIISSLPDEALQGSISESEAMVWLEKALSLNLPLMDQKEIWSEGKSIITLVGSTGIGKSTSLAKIAHRFAIEEGESNVVVMTLDVNHQGPLRQNCEALGIKFRVIEEYENLGRVLDKHKGYKLILLDTPGYGHRHEKLEAHFDRLAKCEQIIRPVLVLNANSDIESLGVMADAYMRVSDAYGMKIDECVITKVDEAARIGAVLNTVADHSLRLTYQSSGNDIVDGFNKVNVISLVNDALSHSKGLAGEDTLFGMEEQGNRFEATKKEILTLVVKMNHTLTTVRQELNNKGITDRPAYKSTPEDEFEPDPSV